MARLADASEPPFIMLLKSVIFCAIIAGAIAGPTGARGTSKCVSFCKESTKFGYETGTIYHYDYTTDISTSVNGGSTHESRIHLKARAEISAISPCELELTLKNVVLEESDPENINSRQLIEGSQVLSQELSSQPLRFSFQDGKIEHLCASEDDLTWAVNIKRGVISTLQNTMETLSQGQTTMEVDVSGRCQTKYQPTRNGNSWAGSNTFQKIKDLTGCSQRHSHISALQSIPYTSNSLMQSIPLLSGQQECTQTIRDGKVDKVECLEAHKFQPFQNEATGAQTIITQTLVYDSEQRGTIPRENNLRTRKTTLLFQNQGPSDASAEDILNIIAILDKLEHDSVPEIRAEAPHHFFDLVENLRLINFNAMKNLFGRVTSPIAKKYLLDAMPIVASAPSLTLMRDLLLNDKLSDKQVDAWLTSLIFIKNPTLDMISALKPLLNQGPRNQALLGISALINSYCKEHTTCTDEDDVKESLEHLFTYLGADCDFSTDEEKRQVLYALKAIGNAGRFPSDDDNRNHLTLNRCLLARTNPAEVRLAAIDAFRRMPCRQYDNQPILSVYSNMNEDTEVRIKSYLASMKCADRQLIDTVKDVLYTDAVNQVSSFVWTHLTNLQETSSPDKQIIRDLLTNDFLKNKFNTDARKYSRNYEGALYREDWNAGATSEADLIFTPDSFFPRSGMVNLTVHLFGTSVNLLEFGGRVKSLEQLLEPIFGPQGYFPDDSVTKALHTMRRKRDVSNNEVERLSSIYDQASQDVASPSGSIYARIFGHEVMYKNFDLLNENNEPSIVDENGKNWLDMSTLMGSLTQGKDIEYSKSVVLLDATYTVATSVGIPLSLAVKSAATVGVVANGKIDLDKFWDEKELDVQGLLRPSAAVQVDGILSAQLGRANSGIRSGLRLQNILHSSTAVQGKVTMKGTKLIHASLSLPQDKQEIFKASSQLLILRPSGNHMVEQGPVGAPKIQHQGCKVSNILGLEFCGEIDVPEQFDFPLATPAVVALYLQKTDTFNSYEFDYRFNNDHSETSVSVTFDTPGSRIDRRLAANFLLDVENGKLDASIQTPSKSFNVDGKYSASLKQLQLTVSALQEQVLLINTALYKQGNRLEPSLLLKFYNRPLLEIQGNVDLLNINEPNGRASFDMNVKHLTQTPIRFDGDISRNDDKYATRVGIESYLLTGNARSQMRVKPGHLSVKSSAEYSWKKSETNNADLSFKIQDTKKGTLSRLNAQLNFAIADAPDNNLDFSFESQKSNGYCENTLKFSLGKSVWEGHSLYKNQFSKEQQDLSIQLSLAAPRHEIDYNVEFTHQLNNTRMLTKFSGRTNPANEVKAEIFYLDESNNLLKKSLTAIASWPSSEYSLRSNLKELSTGDYEGELIIAPNDPTEMKATITYKNSSNNVKLDHVLEFRARGFTDAPITGKAALSASDKQFHTNAQLEIEGRSNYNGRWSTSLDYAVVKKNTHKIEGKLTLNENKYTGEINFKKTKTGENILSIDLKAKRRVTIEATLKGDLPGPIFGSLSFHPDRDSRPGEKFGLEGTFDPRANNLKVDYFGQEIITSASYSDTKLKLELNLWGEQQYSLLVDAPEFELHKINTSVTLETPIEGFRNIVVVVNHECNAENIETRLSGRIDQFETTTSLTASHDDRQTQVEALLEATGIQTLKGLTKLVRQRNDKSFEITLQRGIAKKTLKANFSRGETAISSNFYFTGCGLIPEITAEVSHQMGNQLNSYVKAEWAQKGSNAQQISAQLTGKAFPLKAKLLVKTPWDNFETVEGGLTFRESSTERDVEVTINADFDMMPLTLKTHCSQDGLNFKHDIETSWNSQRNVRTAKFSSEGRYFSLANAEVDTKLTIPDHVYELKWSTEKNHKAQKLAVDIAYDQKRYSSGIGWSYEPRTNQILASAFCERQNQPRFSLEFEHMKRDKDFKMHLMSQRGEEILMKFTTDLYANGLYQWDFKSLLQSSFGTLPTINVMSKHSAQVRGEIQHKSQITFGTKYGIQTLRRSEIAYGYETTELTAELNFQGGRHINAVLSFEDNNVTLQGEIEQHSTGNKITLDLSSTFFTSIQLTGEFTAENNRSKVALSTSSNGNNIIAINAETQVTDNVLQGDIEVDCSFGHHLIASAVLNINQKQFEVTLKEDRANLIDLSLRSQVQQNKGYGNIDIRSEILNIPDNVHLTAEYDMKDEYNFGLKYNSNQHEKSIVGKAAWSDETKKIELTLNTVISGVFKAELMGLTKVETSLVLNGESIFHVTGTHSLEQGDYTFGKHSIQIRAVTGESQTPFEITTTVGIDLNKFLLIIETPIQGWTSIKVDSHFSMSDPRKTFSLLAEKEQDVYAIKADTQLTRKDGKLSIEITTPFQGYSTLDIQLEYTNRNSIEGKIQVGIESQKFKAQGMLSPSKVDALLETPFNSLKKVFASSTWNLSGASNNILMNAGYNDSIYQLQGQWTVSKTAGDALVTFTATEEHKIHVNYDLSNEYKGHITLNSNGQRRKIGGRVALNREVIELQAYTPLQGYENIQGKVQYNKKSPNHHSVSADWKLNGEGSEFTADVKLLNETIQIEAKTPISGCETIDMELIYQIDGAEKLLSATGKIGQGKPFKLTIQTKLNGIVFKIRDSAVASIKINLEVPVEDLETFTLTAQYKRERSVHTLSASALKNKDTVSGNIKVNLPQTENFALELEANVSAPSFGIQLADIDGKVTIDLSSVSTAIAQVSLNGEKQGVEAAFEVTQTTIDVQIQTTFDILKTFRISGRLDDDGKYQATLLINDQQSTIKGQYLFTGARHTKIIVELSCPIEGLESIKTSAEIKFYSGSLNAAFAFQNQRHRYITKLQGTYDSSQFKGYLPAAADLKLTVNSPAHQYENIIAAINYSLKQNSFLKLSVSRNTKEEINGEAVWNNNEIKLNLVSSLPNYPINTKNSISWSEHPFNAAINLEAGAQEYRVSLNTNIQGLKSGDITLSTTISEWENVNVKWNIQGTTLVGQALATLNLGKFGDKSIRSSWKNDDWEAVKIDLWYKPNTNEIEKGFSAQYTIVGGRMNGTGKIAATLAYIVGQKQQQLTFSTSLKRTTHSTILDIAIHTPYEVIREATLHGKLSSNQEISLDVQAALNKNVLLTSNSIIAVGPMASKLKLSFNAPDIGEPFSLNVAYDLKTSQKYVELSFNQNKYQISIRADATVPQNSNEIELHMNVDSNVPLLQVSASGSIKAGYKIDSDETRHLMVSVNSLQTGKWEVTGALRLLSDFHAKLHVSSPRQEILPSVKFEVNHRGSLRQGISSDAAFQLAQYPEIKSTISVTVDKVLATFVSGISGFENMSLEAKLESGSGYANQKFQVVIQAMGKQVTLGGFFNIPSKSSRIAHGSLELNSDWDKIKNGAIRLRVEHDGSIEITGNWGDQNLAIRGTSQTERNQYWWMGASTDLVFEINSEEFMKIRTNHLISDQVYSFNITLDENYTVKSYVQTDSDKILSVSANWASDKTVRIIAEAGSGRFTTSVETPWTSPMTANGMYIISDKEQQAKGHFEYDGQRSSLEAHARKSTDAFESSVSVNIPALHQKLDAELKIRKLSDKALQGSIDLKMQDRRLTIQGEFTDTEVISSRRKTALKNLKLFMTLPSTSYPQVSSEISVQLPTVGFASFQTEASITLPRGVSKAAVGYEVPIDNAQQVGVRAMIDSPFVSENPIEFIISTEIEGVRKFQVRFQHKNNDVQLAWDTKLPQLKVEALVQVPELLPTHSPLRFQVDGTINAPSEISLKFTGSCSQYSFNVESQVVQTENSIDARLAADIPTLFKMQREIKFRAQKNVSGRYVLDVSFSKGSKSVELTTEIVLQQGTISASGKVTGAYGNHFIQFRGNKEGNNWEVEMNGESLTLLKGKRVNAVGLFKPTQNGIEIDIECRTRGFTHTGKFIFTLDPRNGQLSVRLESSTFKSFRTNIEWSVDSKSFTGKIVTFVQDERHEAEVIFNTDDLEAQITVQSPLVPGEEFNIHGKATARSNNVNLIGDAKWNGAQWRFQGTTRYVNAQDMEVKLELKTPFEDWERITFAGKVDSDEILAEIFTPFKNFPNAMFKISGIPIFQKASLETFNNIQPLVVLGLPWITYSASAIIKLPQPGNQGEFQISFEYGKPKSSNKKYEASLQFPSLEDINLQMIRLAKVRFEAKLPIKHLSTIQWELGGRLHWKTWAELNAIGELNGKKIELTSEVRNEKGNRRLSVNLSTPFQGYENYIASVRLENYEEIGTGRSILVELQRPGWDRSVRLEIDYRYRFNGLTDMDGEVNIAAPTFVVDFPPLSLQMQSSVRDGIYTGQIGGTWSELRPSFKIEAGMLEDRVFAVLEGMASPVDQINHARAGIELTRQGNDVALNVDVQYKREQIFLTEAAFSHPTDMIDIQFSVKTPFTILKSATAVVRLSPLGKKDLLTIQKSLNNLDISLEASYNNNKLIQIELVNKNGRRSLKIHNPIRPISLALTFERVVGQKIRIHTEVCWNLNKASESTIGLEIILSKTSAARNALFKIHAGEIGEVEVVMSHMLTSTKFDQGLRVVWFSPSTMETSQELGYTFNMNDVSTSNSKKYDINTRIDTPWRSVQVEASHNSTAKESYNFAELKWDIKKDASKRVGFKSNTESTLAWRSRSLKNTFTLMHSILPNDFVIVLDRTYKNNKIQTVELSIQPTEVPDNHLVFSVSKENMDGKVIQIILSHGASNLRIEAEAKKIDASLALALSYVDIRGETQVAQFLLTRDNSGQIFEIRAGQALTTIFRVQYLEEEDKTTFNLRSKELQLDLNIHQNRPLVDMTVEYDSGKQLYISVGLPHKKEISARIWRNEYGLNIQDVLLALRLNTSQALSTKFNWRPELLHDVYYVLTNTAPRTVKEHAEASLSLIKLKVGEELQGRWNMLHPSARQTLETLAVYTQFEIQAIFEEVRLIADSIKNMYEQNAFYTKDVIGIISTYVEGVQAICGNAYDILSVTLKSTAQVATDIISLLCSLFHEYAGKLENSIVPLLNGAEDFVMQQWSENLKALATYIEIVEDVYDTFVDTLEGRIEKIEERIMGISFVRKCIRLYQDYSTWIEELPMQEYVVFIQAFLNERIWRPLEIYYKPYFDAINEAMEDKNIQAILELPPIPYVRHVSLKIKNVVGRFLGFIEAEQKLKDLLTKAIQAVDNMVRRNIPSYTLIWEIEKGQIEYHQPLTIIEWEDFTTLPQLKSSEQNENDINKMSDFYYQVMDTMTSMKPVIDMDIRDILPPFGAYAVMAGDHHYYTFDKKYFRFAGECSYVLAADLLHKNFSLLVNYETRDGDIRKKSYTLVSNNQSIDIDTNNLKVSLDGRKAELPLEVGSTFIRRQPNSLEVFDTRGFQMTCTQIPAVCTVTISGWYFGKVAGLLGTYDNEHMNDMRTPDGQIVTDVSNFAHSWRVGRNSDQCRMKNFARNVTETTDVDGICSQHFDDRSSLLRPCFSRVDSTVFSDMCRYDTSRNLNKASRQESACNAISAYVAECQKNGVDVWLPPTCIRCRLEDGTTLLSGENATLETNGDVKPPNSTDVVVLLEEASCLSRYTLTDVIRKLDDTLKLQGLNENRYTLVGFAGKGPHSKPHIRTSSGQVWAHSTLFKISENILMNGDGRGDLYEAIEFAASTLKFRAGVSKTIIAITCGDEGCGSERHYADTLTLLTENDIKLHMLTPKVFTTKRKDSVSRTIFGIDIEGVYTSNHMKKTTIEADTSLRRQINWPKDLCTPLAVETNGSRFHLHQTSRKFLDVWTRRVAMTAQPSECQHCECIPDKSGSPHVVCNKCFSPLPDYATVDEINGEFPAEMMDFE